MTDTFVVREWGTTVRVEMWTPKGFDQFLVNGAGMAYNFFEFDNAGLDAIEGELRKALKEIQELRAGTHDDTREAVAKRFGSLKGWRYDS